MERFGDARFDRCLAQGAMATPLLEALPQAFQTARVAAEERGRVQHDAQTDAALEEIQQRIRPLIGRGFSDRYGRCFGHGR